MGKKKKNGLKSEPFLLTTLTDGVLSISSIVITYANNPVSDYSGKTKTAELVV